MIDFDWQIEMIDFDWQIEMIEFMSAYRDIIEDDNV